MTSEPLQSYNPHVAAYRAEIDGLRAVAGLAVVAFHAFPSRPAGGFVGVDIFFVISGLICPRQTGSVLVRVFGADSRL